MSESRRLFRRGAGFALVPALAAVTALLLLPIIARVGGPAGWLAIGVGQSLGSIAAVAISLGWTIHGPATVAPIHHRVARVHFGRSLTQRAIVATLVLPVVSASAILLTPDPDLYSTAVLSALSIAVMGFSPAWYWVGRGEPRKLVAFEAAPRLAANLISAPIVLLTGAVFWFPLLALIALMISYLYFARVVAPPRLSETNGSIRRAVNGIATNLTSWLTVLTAGVYTSASVALVAVVAVPAAATMFVTGDRIYKIAVQSIAVTGNTTQGWVAELGSQAGFARRVRASLSLHLIVGIAGATFLGLAGPWLSAALLGNAVAASSSVMWGFALAFLALALNSGVGRTLLAPLELGRVILASTLVGAAVGLPGIIVGTIALGAAGGALAVGLAELAVLVTQLLGLAHVYWRRGRRHRGSTVDDGS